MAILVALAALTACSLLRGQRPVAEGDQLPALTFSTLDGRSAALQASPGKVTFVNVFATWCPPCKAETPDLVAFSRWAAANGVDVIGIDQQESAAQVEAFAQTYGIRYPLMIDSGRQTKDVLGARIIPRTIVIGRNGLVVAVVSGPMTGAQMRVLAARAAAAR